MIKIVAIGNRYMKDDGIALIVAEHLKKDLSNPSIKIMIEETDSFNSFCQLDEGDFVIIIDAIHTGACAGSVRVFSIKEAVAQSAGLVLQHDMSMFDFIRIYHSEIDGYLIGIEVFEVGFGDGISDALNTELPRICSKIETIIQNIATQGTLPNSI